MKAKEWIQRIKDNPHWGRVDIDHEAVDEIDALLSGSELNEMGRAALFGGLTILDIKTLANLKHKGFMPMLNELDQSGASPHTPGCVRWLKGTEK